MRILRANGVLYASILQILHLYDVSMIEDYRIIRRIKS